MNLRAMREVNTGFGDGLASAFELVATTSLFAFFGYLLDNRFGTGPWIMLSFGIFVFGYEMWKVAYRYTTEMEAHTTTSSWSRKATATDAGADDLDTAQAAAEVEPSAGAKVGAAGKTADEPAGLDIGSMWVNEERPA